MTWQFVTTTDGATVTPDPTDSVPSVLAASTLTTLLDKATKVARLGVSAFAAVVQASAIHAIEIAHVRVAVPRSPRAADRSEHRAALKTQGSTG
jgi:hypothetical protein